VKKEKGTSKDAGLRSRAEERLAGKKSATDHQPAEADARRMVHELQVHQIELELQNEELIRTREELEKQFEKYSDLYNFAPVGYFTLDEHGAILEANLTGAKLLGIDRSRMMSRRFGSFLSDEARPGFDGFLRNVYDGTAAQTCEVALAGDRFRYLQIEGIAVGSGEGKPGQCRMAVMDSTMRKLVERRQYLSAEIMEILSDPPALADAINRILAAIRRETGFDAVGIRLREGDDFPYFVQNGFSDDFLLTENRLTVRAGDGGLCRDKNGNPSLECTCGLVISGQTDPTNPFFTQGGSFWTNNALPLLDLPVAQDPRLHPRNHCIHEGFRSVALIPIRANRDIVGLLQLNDRKKDCFTREMIPFFEGISASIGVALMRKQAEERLRLSEERHRSYIEVTGELGWTTNRHGDVVEDLPTWRNFTGQSAEEIRGAGWTNALHPDDVEQTTNAWNNAVATKTPYEVEYRIRRRDGMYRHFLARGLPVSNQDGTIREWVGTCIDITERKASQEILSRYELLSQNSRDIVLFIRRDDGRILEANVAATNAYGYSHDELLKLTINDLRASETLGLTAGQMAQADAQSILFETVHRRKDGSTFPAEVSSQGATIDGIRMLISMVRDITQRNLLDRALRQAHDGLELRVRERTIELERAYEALQAETEQRRNAEMELRQAQKIEAVGMLAGGIAHDFNNILAAIIGFAELAKDETPEGSPARRYMERVFSAGIRGRDLVKQILTFSRRAEQEKRPLKLASVVEETLKLLRPALPSTMDIRTNLQSESGFVLADETQMQQIVMNLCTNAAHAMRRTGGRISIDLSGYSFSSPKDAPDPTMRPGLYVRLSVSDTGEGMSSDTLERVFDPFFTTKPQGEGTGLGLSVVHGIVASHGGTITVSSELGRGSSFTVYLPKHREDGARGSTGGEGAIPRGHERVLFIDDEEDVAAIGDQMLTRLGYHVTSRTSSRQALALFRLNPSDFDVVVTDQTMPELTGVELAEEILALRPDMPIIMCTGFSHVVDADSAKAAGIRAFVVKPLSKKEIAQTIRGVLDNES
jgi:PAS domain S-box-containing protein